MYYRSTQNRTDHPSRRLFLRASGVGLALPLLDRFTRKGYSAGDEQSPQRLVCICTSLGLHPTYFFPSGEGNEYVASDYLKIIEEHRNDFTVFNGLSNSDQSGSDGHASGMTWLTAAQHPGLPGFRNTISIDQWIAQRIGLETRFPSLQFSTDGSSQSYTSSGIMIPGEQSPSRLFAKLFLDGSASEIETQVQRLREGRSIIDTVLEEAKQFGRRVGKEDKERLVEYYNSVREMEKRLEASEAWVHKPKPKVDARQPEDIKEKNDLIGQTNLLFELIPLALQTDSTRLITVMIQGRNDVPPIPGVSIDHHNLSHHGQDAEKIRQLRLVEEAQMKSLEKLLAAMKRKTEGGRRLIDSTAMIFGSNLGNANSHDTKNLPLILAGGRFRHGKYIAMDKEKNTPLSNLFVQVAQQMGQPLEQFGASTSTSVPGLST